MIQRLVEGSTVVAVVLLAMRLALFALSLGLTLISFRAYRRRPTDRFQYAFLGFAFLSMGTALSMLVRRIDATPLIEIAEIVPYLVGFSMLYLSLYRD